RSLRDAVELASRRDPDLPHRRVLVVLSDGLDEGSGMTAEDVLLLLREQRLPVYSIGFGGAARRESLDLLLRFSTNSGGRFVEVEGSDFATAYDRVREAIGRVWVVGLDCPSCRADGGSYRLQMNLRLADRVLSKGVDLRLLPPVDGPATLVAPPAPSADPADDRAAVDTAAPAQAGATDPLPLVLGGLAAVGALAAVVVTVRRRGSGARPEPDATARKPRTRLNRRERKLNEIPLDAAPAIPPKPVRLVVVRGEEPGREYRFLLRDRALLGSSRKSDFRVEEGIAAEQMELKQEQGRVVARNLARRDPTLVNGVPLDEVQPLKSGDLVGNGRFIARVVLG
ncbi:MAG: hypothetical protein R3190_13760, partial [Thermoanaerobaculia bacterium]|nr:hypothetical protein [Thermoanaerobaculia bacterium]